MTSPIDLAPLQLTISSVDTVIPVAAVGLANGNGMTPVKHSGRLFESSILHAGGGAGITVTVPVRFAMDTFGLGVTSFSAGKQFCYTFDSDGKHQSGANNVAWSAASGGRAVITRIGADQKGVVWAQVQIIPFAADDRAYPWVRSDDETIPALASEPVLNTLALMANGGVKVGGLRNLQIDLGQNLRPLQVDGRRYAREALYRGGTPRITGAHTGVLDLQAVAGEEGVAVSDLDFYLRENDPTNGTLKETGIELAVAEGWLYPVELDLTQDVAGAQGFAVTPLSDSDTHPIAYTASATIPT